MGLFDFMKKRDTGTSLPITTPEVNDVLLQALINGEAITREKAMTLPAVAGAVDFISNMIASMPVKLYKYKQGKVEKVEGDTRVALLNGDTGDTLDAFQLKKAMVEDYLLDKGGYAYIRRNRNEVTGLFYVKPIEVALINNYHPIFKNYRIIVYGSEYYPHDFLKLLRKTENGSEGTGITQELSKALETAYQTLIYQLGLVSTGGNKKGFLKAQNKLSQDEINILKAAWQNLYGNNNTEKVVVLNKGVEFQEASNSSVEMQLNESKTTLIQEINNIFHIKDDFYETFKQAIYPIVKAFSTAMNTTLLQEKEKGKYYFDLDVKEIIKANVKERYDAYKVAKETGWLSFNEIRRMENMNDIEGLDVVNVGLGAVLYDFNTHQYYTPNTDTTTDPTTDGTNPDTTDQNIEKVMTDKVIDTEFEDSGNSSAREERFNPNHDSKTGKFTTGGGSGGSAGGSSEGSGGSSGSDSEGGSSSGGGSSSNVKYNLENRTPEFQNEVKGRVDKLKGEYNTPLKEVNSISGKEVLKTGEQGHVNGDGTSMSLSSSKPEVVYHEFAHTLITDKRANLLKENPEVWEQVKKVEKNYKKAEREIDKKSLLGNDPNFNRLEELKKIAINPDDSYFKTNTDEFFAEAFSMAKLGKTQSPYAKEILKIVDENFKK